MHEETKMKLLRCTAPFESFNTPEDKAEWLDQYRENIRQEYKRRFNREPVSDKFATNYKQTTYKNTFVSQPQRRTTEVAEDMARKEEEAIAKRRRNYPGRLGE